MLSFIWKAIFFKILLSSFCSSLGAWKIALSSNLWIIIVLDIAQVHSHLENSLKITYQSAPEMFLVPKMGKYNKINLYLQILAWFIIVWMKCKNHSIYQFMHCHFLIVTSMMKINNPDNICALIHVSVIKVGLLVVAPLSEVQLGICSASRGYSASRVLILYPSASTLESIDRNTWGKQMLFIAFNAWEGFLLLFFFFLVVIALRIIFYC